MIHGFDDSTKEKVSLLNFIYPVGSIYMSVNTTSPATLFGGTWEKIKDKFLLSSGDTYSNGATGGEATHTLSTEEMPNHYHDINLPTFTKVDSSWVQTATGASMYEIKSGSADSTTSKMGTGGSQAHNNMPPYLVVNVWKRTD